MPTPFDMASQNSRVVLGQSNTPRTRKPANRSGVPQFPRPMGKVQPKRGLFGVVRPPVFPPAPQAAASGGKVLYHTPAGGTVRQGDAPTYGPISGLLNRMMSGVSNYTQGIQQDALRNQIAPLRTQQGMPSDLVAPTAPQHLSVGDRSMAQPGGTQQPSYSGLTQLTQRAPSPPAVTRQPGQPFPPPPQGAVNRMPAQPGMPVSQAAAGVPGMQPTQPPAAPAPAVSMTGAASPQDSQWPFTLSAADAAKGVGPQDVQRANLQRQEGQQILQNLQQINAGNVPQGPFSQETESLAAQALAPRDAYRGQQDAARAAVDKMMERFPQNRVNAILNDPEGYGKAVRSGRPGWDPMVAYQRQQGGGAGGGPQPGYEPPNIASPERQQEIMATLREMRSAPGSATASGLTSPNSMGSDAVTQDNALRAKLGIAPRMEVGANLTPEQRAGIAERRAARRAPTVDMPVPGTDGQTVPMTLRQMMANQDMQGRKGRLEQRRQGPNPMARMMMNNPALAMQWMRMQQTGNVAQQELAFRNAALQGQLGQDAQQHAERMTQGQQQHTERMAQYNAVSPTDRYTMTVDLIGRGYTPQQAEQEVNRITGQQNSGRGTEQIPGSPSAPSFVPPDLASIEDDETMISTARQRGYTDEQIRAFLQKRSGRQSASLDNPAGMTLWGALNTGGPLWSPKARDALGQWWRGD